MTIGGELRKIRDGVETDVKEKLKDWFDEHMDELRGSALGGSDCIIYNDEETYNFFKKYMDEYEIIFGDFCEEESIEIEISLDTKQVIISWNEMYTEG